MWDDAQKWFSLYLKRYLTESDTAENVKIKIWIENFVQFKIKIKRMIKLFNKDKIAI